MSKYEQPLQCSKCHRPCFGNYGEEFLIFHSTAEEAASATSHTYYGDHVSFWSLSGSFSKRRICLVVLSRSGSIVVGADSGWSDGQGWQCGPRHSPACFSSNMPFDGSGVKLLDVCVPQRSLKTSVRKPPGEWRRNLAWHAMSSKLKCQLYCKNSCTFYIL